MRFEYPKKFFRNAGRVFFNSKEHSPTKDDSVTNEEKNELLKENEEPQLNSNNSPIENLIELAEKISIELNNLRGVLEKAKENPVSKEWVESTLTILARSVNLAHTYGHKELEKILINIARILLSADRVGKAGLILENFYLLYTKLCVIITDLLLGKSQEKTFESAVSTYNNILFELEKKGIKLISDDEELIEQINEEVPQYNKNQLTQQPTQIFSTSVETPSENSPLPDIVETPLPILNYDKKLESTPSSNISSSVQSDSFPPEVDAEEVPEQEISQTRIEEDQVQTGEASELQKHSNLQTSIQPVDYTSEILTEYETKTSDNNLTTSNNIELSIQNERSPKPTKSETESSYTNPFSNIKNENLKNKLEATLKALVENSPEVAKEKALELAIEIANLEIEEIKKQQKVTEIQIETLKSELEQVDITIHESKYEEEEIIKELQAQEKQKEDILKEKQNTENELLKIKDELQSIEDQIALLLKKKEEALKKIENTQQTLNDLHKNIEEAQLNINSIRDTLNGVESKITALNEKKLSLLSVLNEKQNTLSDLSEQIRKKEDTLLKLRNSLDLIKFSNEHYNDNPTPKEIDNDLFSGDI